MVEESAARTPSRNSETSSPTSMQSKTVNKAVDKSSSSPVRGSPVRGASPKAKGKNKSRATGKAKNKANSGRKANRRPNQNKAKSTNVTFLSENCDPAKVLWRAIHLDEDTERPALVKDIISHARLPGTLLAVADGRTRIDVLQAACRLGVDFRDIKDEGSSWNVLHAAVSSGSLDVLQTMMEELKPDQIAALINEYSALLGTTQWTPLLIAVKNGFAASVPILLKNGADPMLPVHLVTPDVISRKTGTTINKKEGCVYPIFFAIKNCPCSGVQAIFDAMMAKGELKVSEITDSKQRTMMHYLSERPTTAVGSTEEIFQYLLALDREFLLSSDVGGNTPLHEAARRGLDQQASNFINLLESAGVDMTEAANKLNKNDISPIVLAVATGISQTAGRLMAYNEVLTKEHDDTKTSYAKDIQRALDRHEITHAVNLAAIHTTEMDDFEIGTLNTFIALTQDPEQTQLIRAVKRLGALTCMQFITDFTQSQFSSVDTTKFKKDGGNGNKQPRTKGGHFLTLLKNRLLKDDRHEDWMYIRVLAELTHKKMRGRPRKGVTKESYAKALKKTN